MYSIGTQTRDLNTAYPFALSSSSWFSKGYGYSTVRTNFGKVSTCHYIAQLNRMTGRDDPVIGYIAFGVATEVNFEEKKPQES